MDDPNPAPSGYQSEVVWSGLNWANSSIVPHFQSDHPESEPAGAAKDFLVNDGIQHWTLADGEVIFGKDGKFEVFPRIAVEA